MLSKKMFFVLFAIYIMVFCTSIAVSHAATISATSASYADVSAAISAANSGDTVIVPAGSATWDNYLVITKGINLIGAGIGNTVITSNYNGTLNWANSDFLVSYVPSNPAADEVFRLSGFSFELAAKVQGIKISNTSTTPITKVRLDHVYIHNPKYGTVGKGLSFMIYGNVFGVADHNIIYSAIREYGIDTSAWTNLTFASVGTVPNNGQNFYFEDNTLYLTGAVVAYGEAGGRYAYRYNTIDITGVDPVVGAYPVMDAHGNNPGASAGTMGWEVYGNNVIGGNVQGYLVDMRGGKGVVFNNNVNTTGSWAGPKLREEYLDSSGPGPVSDPGGQPQHLSGSYIWNNLKNDTTITDAFISQTVDYGGSIGIVPQFGVDAWIGVAGFNGTTGMGCGTLASRPPTCTMGVGYWATNQSCTSLTGMVGPNPTSPISGTLYKCTATNTWTAYYSPYTYPHPLVKQPNPPPDVVLIQ